MCTAFDIFLMKTLIMPWITEYTIFKIVGVINLLKLAQLYSERFISRYASPMRSLKISLTLHLNDLREMWGDIWLAGAFTQGRDSSFITQKFLGLKMKSHSRKRNGLCSRS